VGETRKKKGSYTCNRLFIGRFVAESPCSTQASKKRPDGFEINESKKKCINFCKNEEYFRTIYTNCFIFKILLLEWFPSTCVPLSVVSSPSSHLHSLFSPSTLSHFLSDILLQLGDRPTENLTYLTLAVFPEELVRWRKLNRSYKTRVSPISWVCLKIQTDKFSIIHIFQSTWNNIKLYSRRHCLL